MEVDGMFLSGNHGENLRKDLHFHVHASSVGANQRLLRSIYCLHGTHSLEKPMSVRASWFQNVPDRSP